MSYWHASARASTKNWYLFSGIRTASHMDRRGMHSSHRESSSCSFHSRYIAGFLAFLSINTDTKCQLLLGIIERASTEQVEVLVEYPNNIECLSIPPFRHPSLPTSLPPDIPPSLYAFLFDTSKIRMCIATTSDTRGAGNTHLSG